MTIVYNGDIGYCAHSKEMFHASNSKTKEEQRFPFEPTLDSYCVNHKFHWKKQRSHDITGTTNYYVSWSYIKDLFYWIDKGYEKGCGEVIEVFLISYYTCIYSLSLKFISKIHTANLPVFSQFISIGPSKMHCDCSDLWFWFTSIIDKFHLSIEL